VCEHKNALIFVEVRFRRTADFGSPAETVDARKQRKLRASAEHYLQQHPAGSKKAARFDIVAIQGPLPNPRIEWLVNTF
jgi:putative endonuclease